MGFLAVAGCMLLASAMSAALTTKPSKACAFKTPAKAEQKPGQARFFCGAELLAMDLFSRRRDLELQIRCACRPLAAVDP